MTDIEFALTTPVEESQLRLDLVAAGSPVEGDGTTHVELAGCFVRACYEACKYGTEFEKDAVDM